MYGLEILSKTDVSQGSLYAALHRLQRDGFLTHYYQAPEKGGNIRKYYQLTEKGKETVLAAKETLFKIWGL